MDSWDFVLLGAAAFVAVSALVRLMVGRREQLLGQFRLQRQRPKDRQGEAPSQDSQYTSSGERHIET
jgi:hypothetical protein